jgi:Dolichyl-phosphate-mannose-protein mannosyltransferase
MIPARARFTVIALFACAAAAGWFIGPAGPVYWDTFGYLTQALTGQVGGLGLGRPVFIWVSYAVSHGYLAAGGSVWHVEPLLRTCWLLVSATTAPATWVLARTSGLSPRASLLAGLVVAVSPAFAHTSANVLTDGPAAAVVAWSLAAGALATVRAANPETRRGAQRYAWLAGALLGIACGLREESALFAVSLALMWSAAPTTTRRRLAVAMTVAAVVVVTAPVVLVALTQPGYADTVAWWLHAVAPVGTVADPVLRRLGAYLAWLVALGPVAVAAALVTWIGRPAHLLGRQRLLLAVCLPAAIQLLALASYPEISYGPRYLVSVFPGAVALPAGLTLDRWLGASRARLALVGAALLVPVLAARPLVQAGERSLRRTIAALPAALLQVPEGSVIVTGQPCPAIPLVEHEYELDPAFRGGTLQWQAVCPGSAWPANLAARLDTARAEHRVIVLDLRATSWLGVEQQHSLAQAVRYRDAHAQAIASGEIVIWQ